ncbi:LOW QUALITY PROTEIN: uncharacterized protein [Macrobrachium rosenbergii]|uniref:LOW QUALITY PROTEIN: uncharacterized protein n=1 Tax=Macrobrachium rosenbergii TaxID=79674 RepID=UPI0034D59EC9
MALLHRFVKLNDRGNTHVFSFVVTRSVTRDLHRDVTSKELTYGYQRWAITFSRSEKVLGVYLVWRNPCEGMRVYIDFTFTLLNREHFSVNEAFTGKQVKFTFDSPAQGNRRLINMDDLYSRNFTDENGEFQLELTVANIRTVFEAELRVPPPLNGGGAGAGAAGGIPQNRKESRYESPYFHFGHYDWHVSVTGSSSSSSGSSSGSASEGRPSVQLRRLTGFDHQCRVRYLMVVGEGERRADSGILDQLSDHEGRTPGWTPSRTRLSDLVHKGVLRLYLEMILANTTSEVRLQPLASAAAAAGGGVVPPVQCYDRDKQAWALEPDLHSDMFRLRLMYNDIHNVPRNHLRYVCRNAYLLRRASRGYVESVCLANGPFSNLYYAQETSDDGLMMESDVPVKEIKEGPSPYVDERKELTVQIEWVESLLLFQATYHKYDDVTRMHNYQMRREITALEAENFSLERQLFSYQKSIAYAHSRGGVVVNDPNNDYGHHRHHGVGVVGGGGGGHHHQQHVRAHHHYANGKRGAGVGLGLVGGPDDYAPQDDEEDDEDDYDYPQCLSVRESNPLTP